MELCRYIGLRSVEGSFGIEIETSSSNPYPVPDFKYWNHTGDGSLRGFGIEYILKTPKDIKSLSQCFAEFSNKTSMINFNNDSYCSVHVHMNVTKFQVAEVMNLIALWYLFEDILVSYCGEGRDGNLFCLKNKQAEGTFLELISNIREYGVRRGRSILNYSNDRHKYGALNLASISRLGSLEVRSFGGMQNTDDVMNWVRILNCIYEKAQSSNNVIDLYKEVCEAGMLTFFYSVFEDIEPKTLCDNPAFIAESMSENLFYLETLCTELEKSGANFALQKQAKSRGDQPQESVQPTNSTDAYEWLEYISTRERLELGGRQPTVRLGR